MKVRECLQYTHCKAKGHTRLSCEELKNAIPSCNSEHEALLLFNL